MDEHELTPIDELPPDIGDVLPTEDEDEDTPVDDEPYDPDMPDDSAGPDAVQDAPDMVPDFVEEPDDIDVLPTEDEEEETPVDDEPDGGEQPEEEDVLVNTVQVPVIGAVQEGELVPVIRMGDTPIAIGAAGWGDRMQSEVDLASQAAEEAKEVAEATGQHFWEDENGAHVTEITKEDWQTEEAKPNPFADVSDQKPYHNLLMNSLGILLRTALKNLVSITRSAIAFFDGQGNEASNVVASFGKDGFQVGVTGESHMVGDYHSLQLIDKANAAYLHVSDLRDTTGYALISERFYGDGSTLSFRAQYEIHDVVSVYIPTGSIGYTVSNNWAFVFESAPPDGSIISVRYHTASTMTKAFTFGSRKPNTTVGGMSYAEGHNVTASGLCTHAEGYATVASGGYSHAEGYESEADGMYSHAEGYRTTASGVDAHSEGRNTVASGSHSHAGGYDSIASGLYSFVHGLGLKAVKPFQAVFGQYNEEDPGTSGTPRYLLIIGNGTSDSNRSNALTAGWDGSVDAAGDATIGGALDLTTDDKHISMHDSRLDASYGGVPSTGANVSRVVRMMDSDDRLISRLLLRQAADGRRMASFESHGYDANGNDVWNRLGSIVKANGERTYDVGNPAAFCEVLHVGDYVTNSASNVSTATATFKDLFNFTLAAGTWLVFVTMEFASNATGRRVAMLNTTAGGSGISLQWRSTEVGVSGAVTRAKLAGVLTPSASTKYYVTGWQNSGGNLNLTAVAQAVRIK